MPSMTFTMLSPMPVSAEELYAWHSRPLAFQRLLPPWEGVEMTSANGAFGTDGYRVEFRTRVIGPFKDTWIADAYDFQPGQQFQDRQVKGPFAAWNHKHRFIPNGSNASYLEDHIDFDLPLGLVGQLFGSGTAHRRLKATFNYRHDLTASDLRRHNLYRDRPRLTVAVTGSRGLIGSDLVPFLTTGGHKVVRLVTGKGGAPFDDGTKWVNWDPAAKLDPETFDGIDAVIHLAGDNVASGRWSASKKKRIVDSRLGPTIHLSEAIAALPVERRPRTFLCASAVGFYGNRGEELLTEESPRGEGFFPDVCQIWEDAIEPARKSGVRTVSLRIGVVLSPKSGALGKQLFAFKAGLGATLGSGKQLVPWISVSDTVGAIHHALMNDAVQGPVNVVGPNPVSNREFTTTLGRVLRRPAFFWLPRVALKVMFGGIADEALLASMKAVPQKLLDSGFTFDHTELASALRFVLGR